MGGSRLPPPKPESPPDDPRHRELATIQLLEREIGFLQEEVISVQGIQPASTACKQIADFVACNEDPLMPVDKKKNHSWWRFWKWLCWPCLVKQCCQKPKCEECFNKSSCCGTPKSTINCSYIVCRSREHMCSCCNKSCCYNCCFCL